MKIDNAVLDVIDVQIISDNTSVATVIVNSVYNEDDLPSVRISATRDPRLTLHLQQAMKSAQR